MRIKYFLLICLLTLNYSEGSTLLFRHHQVKKDSVSSIYSDKKLGSFVIDGNTHFNLFAPNADGVTLHLFRNVEDTVGNSFNMKKDKNGVWEVAVEGEHYGSFYGFKVKHKSHKSTAGILCIDPYSKAVATFNDYMNPRKSIVMKDEAYDWEGDDWVTRDWRDLSIYEMHIRDMTAHSSSGSYSPGTYKGLIEKNIKGGINYIKSLGVNTVELLPAQEFGNMEIPYKEYAFDRHNTWNPYSRNHWGYMTAAFFAPESYYSVSTPELELGKWYGTSGKQVTNFKDMVKAFHKEGIGVVMDVVYNHISEYELGNLKEIDRDYYFRMDNKGHFRSESGTGNDLKTENPMVRRLIIESVLFWMKEYHVDGFRFDLGKLIDWITVEEIRKEARKINPSVIIVCEPWGGGYDPEGFSVRGWASWNDQIRNGIKGENPINGHGWIFGKWFGDNNPIKIKSYVNGYLERDKGFFFKKEHSVNYLESHDGYTLGDFIRIGIDSVKPDEIILDKDKNAQLSSVELKLHKLASSFLLTTQGIIMISEGQEFGRSKVIGALNNDPNSGRIDHNSYEKDNETNYLNYAYVEMNKELVNYYKGLFLLRNTYSSFRRADYEDITFYEIKDNEFALAYSIKHENETFVLLFNADTKKEEEFILPEGDWDVLVNKDYAGIKPLNRINGKVILEPSTSLVLIKKAD